MHARRPLWLFALVLPLHACVVAREPFVAKADAVDDARLAGYWETSDSSERATVSREAAGDYVVVYEAKDHRDRYEARPGRWGSFLVLDLRALPDSATAEPSSDSAAHQLLRVEMGEQEARVAALNIDSVRSAIRSGRIALRYVESDNDLVLQGSTAALRAALEPVIGDSSLFGEPGVFRRVAPFRHPISSTQTEHRRK